MSTIWFNAYSGLKGLGELPFSRIFRRARTRVNAEQWRPATRGRKRD
jgi:hypothetical protein